MTGKSVFKSKGYALILVGIVLCALIAGLGKLLGHNTAGIAWVVFAVFEIPGMIVVARSYVED